MSYFNGDQLATVNNRKLIRMVLIPFPVCAYAAIHYEER